MTLHHTRWFVLALLLGLVACQEKKTTKTTNTTTNTDTVNFNTSGSGGGSTGSSTGGSTTGGSTTSGSGGSTTGGSSGAFAYDAVMSGGKTWSIGEVPSDFNDDPSSANYTMGTFVGISADNVGQFSADNQFRVRVRLLEEPVVTGGSTQKLLCSQRTQNVSSNNCLVNGQNQPCKYSKAWYQVGIRNIYDNGNGNYSLGGIYDVRTISSQGVNGLSPVIDWSNSRQRASNIVGWAIAVFNVESDNACLSSPKSSSCPKAMHPSKACWRMRVELSTENTPNAGF